MVKPLSTVRIARSRRTSFTSTEEVQEIDFSLGLRQGIEIFDVEFGALEIIPTVGAIATEWALMELHARIGALEGGLDSFPADDTILNSSIIAAAVFQMGPTFDGSTEAMATSGWLTERNFNFEQLIGKPYLVATNLTMRGITKDTSLVVNGGQITIYYRYVSLSDAELAEQFALGR